MTQIQNHKMPNQDHMLPASKTIVRSDARGVIECTNSDADILLGLPGWARVGDAPRQPAKDSPDEIPVPPTPYVIGGGGIVGEVNREADRLLEEAAALEAAAARMKPDAPLSETATRDEIMAYASAHGVKVPSKVRSSKIEELRAYVVEAIAANAAG